MAHITEEMVTIGCHTMTESALYHRVALELSPVQFAEIIKKIEQDLDKGE